MGNKSTPGYVFRLKLVDLLKNGVVGLFSIPGAVSSCQVEMDGIRPPSVLARLTYLP